MSSGDMSIGPTWVQLATESGAAPESFGVVPDTTWGQITEDFSEWAILAALLVPGFAEALGAERLRLCAQAEPLAVRTIRGLVSLHRCGDTSRAFAFGPLAMMLALRVPRDRLEMVARWSGAYELVASARAADGGEYDLVRGLSAEGAAEWILYVDGETLMPSRNHESEVALAELALSRAKNPRDVLIGGLGLGYTLRAVLDRVADDATVTIAELVQDIVEWNRTHLAALNGNAVDDPRCRVVVGDVFDLLQRSPGAFDVVALDLDNGPHDVFRLENQRLYDDSGLAVSRAALRPGGVLAYWAAGPATRDGAVVAAFTEEGKCFAHRLRHAGFRVDTMRIAAGPGAQLRHVLFLARRDDDRAARAA